jgi:hypothetical protein
MTTLLNEDEVGNWLDRTSECMAVDALLDGVIQQEDGQKRRGSKVRKRSVQIIVRTTAEEKTLIENRAAALKSDVSTYLRTVGMGEFTHFPILRQLPAPVKESIKNLLKIQGDLHYIRQVVGQRKDIPQELVGVTREISRLVTDVREHIQQRLNRERDAWLIAEAFNQMIHIIQYRMDTVHLLPDGNAFTDELLNLADILTKLQRVYNRPENER